MAARMAKDNFDEKVLKSPIPVIVDFYSDSCVACKMLAQQYDIMSNPTLILFKEGAAVDRKVGAQTADVLKAWVEQYL